jgi:hypothetical protein
MAQDSEKDRCAHHGFSGRCQLRNSIGWLCSWHHYVHQGEENTFDAFNRFILEEREAGSERWNRRPTGAWWSLTLGVSGDGGWDLRNQQVIQVDTSKPEAPGY